MTGSLLARKGAAYPASYSAPSTQESNDSDGSDASSSDARAYNDPRVIASAPPAAAVQPSADQGPQMQDGRLVEDYEKAEAGKQQALDTGAAPAAGEGAGENTDNSGLPLTMDNMGRVRLSVRLDPDRYLRVKMASARTRWSAQDIVVAALDKFLADTNSPVGGAGNGSAADGSAGDGSAGDEDSD